jgi:RNA polymerase sigma-70 factor (ECF subfamily)
MEQKKSSIAIMESSKDDQSCVGQLTYGDKKKIFTYIRRFIRDFAQAEDILQDTLLKVFQSVQAGKYSDNGKFLSWVMRIAHNVIIDHFRLMKQMNTISTDNYESDLFNSKKYAKGNIEDDLIKREMHYDVRNMVSRLPDDQKEVVILRHYSGFSFKEIAKITNISINTALGRMRYALINLRKMMKEENIILSII